MQQKKKSDKIQMNVYGAYFYLLACTSVFMLLKPQRKIFDNKCTQLKCWGKDLRTFFLVKNQEILSIVYSKSVPQLIQRLVNFLGNKVKTLQIFPQLPSNWKYEASTPCTELNLRLFIKPRRRKKLRDWELHEWHFRLA